MYLYLANAPRKGCFIKENYIMAMTFLRKLNLIFYTINLKEKYSFLSVSLYIHTYV